MARQHINPSDAADGKDDTAEHGEASTARLRKSTDEPVQDGDMLADPAIARINAGDEADDTTTDA